MGTEEAKMIDYIDLENDNMTANETHFVLKRLSMRDGTRHKAG